MTHHVAFTVVGDLGHIVIRDDARREVRHEYVPLGDIAGELAQWLVCKHALRLAGELPRADVRLYSDCAVIDKLVESGADERAAAWAQERNGRPADFAGVLGQYFDVQRMLWELFRGRWTACRVEQERIVAEVQR